MATLLHTRLLVDAVAVNFVFLIALFKAESRDLVRTAVVTRDLVEVFSFAMTIVLWAAGTRGRDRLSV